MKKRKVSETYQTEFKNQLLELLSATPNKSMIISEIRNHFQEYFHRRNITKQRSQGFIKSIINILKNDGLIIVEGTKKSYNKSNPNHDYYRPLYKLTPKGELSLTINNGLMPLDLRFPYLLLEHSVIQSLRKWQSLKWHTPISTDQITVGQSVHFNNFIKYLYSIGAVELDLSNGLTITTKVKTMPDNYKGVLDQLIMEVIPLLTFINQELQ